ncbi:hypothetical protein AB1E18_006681 [Capra hircus]
MIGYTADDSGEEPAEKRSVGYGERTGSWNLACALETSRGSRGRWQNFLPPEPADPIPTYWGRPRSLSPSGEAERPPPARPPASACGEPARLPAGARERHFHRPAQAQAQALRRAERSSVHPGPASRRGGGGPRIFGESSIL